MTDELVRLMKLIEPGEEKNSEEKMPDFNFEDKNEDIDPKPRSNSFLISQGKCTNCKRAVSEISQMKCQCCEKVSYCKKCAEAILKERFEKHKDMSISCSSCKTEYSVNFKEFALGSEEFYKMNDHLFKISNFKEEEEKSHPNEPKNEPIGKEAEYPEVQRAQENVIRSSPQNQSRVKFTGPRQNPASPQMKEEEEALKRNKEEKPPVVEECSICKIKQDKLADSTCGHKFHRRCLNKRIKDNKVYSRANLECPDCKIEIKIPSSKSYSFIASKYEEKVKKAEEFLKSHLLKNAKELQNADFSKFCKEEMEKLVVAGCKKCDEFFVVLNKEISGDLVCEACIEKELLQEIKKQQNRLKQIRCQKHGLEIQSFKCRFCCNETSEFSPKFNCFLCENCKKMLNKDINFYKNGPFGICNKAACKKNGNHPENGTGDCFIVCFGCSD